MKLSRYRSFHPEYLKDEISRGQIYHWPISGQNDPGEGFFLYGGRLTVFRVYRYLFRAQEAIREKFISKDKAWLTGMSADDYNRMAQYVESLSTKQLYDAAQVIVKEGRLDPQKKGSFMREKHSRMLDRTQIACFSEREDSPAMFAHYGGNHSGVCITYEGESENLFSVEYRKKPAVLDFLETKEDKIFSARVLSKHVEWSNEEEVRHILYDVDPGLQFINGLELTDIKLGVHMKPAEMDLVLRMAKTSVYRQIRVWRLLWSNADYAFEVEQIG